MHDTNRNNANFSDKTENLDKLTEKKLDLLKKTGYSNKVIELYVNRVNVGEIENADVALSFTGPCGDTMKLYLKIEEKRIVEDASFQYLGCPASAACGSILSQLIRGISFEEAKKITENELLKELGSLPDDECHCAKLAVTTLHKTIERYEVLNKILDKPHSSS